LAAALPLALPALIACASAASPAKKANRYPAATTPPADQVNQILSWGNIRQSRAAPADTLFIQAGRRLYLIGDIDGRFRNRSNPYDLYTYGRPLASDPLAGELQGVWAQPVKALDKHLFEVIAGEDRWQLLSAQVFTQTFAYAQFDYHHGTLSATRRDFVPQDQPVLFTTLTLRNTGSRPADVTLAYTAFFDLKDAWFTSLAAQRNQGQTVIIQGKRLLARARAAPEEWAVALGSAPAADEARVLDASKGEFRFKAHLEPRAEQSWTFGVVVESRDGPQAALRNLEAWLPQRETWLAEKKALYDRLLTGRSRLHTPDAGFDAAHDLAHANMQMLEAESSSLGRYFYAGLETFPFWFGHDGAYAPGLLAGGFVSTTLSHIALGHARSERGHVPHQLSPSGAQVGSGNAAETPLWVASVWDAYRWTGDRDFLARLYRPVIQSLFGYTLGEIDPDGDSYPSGPGVVEKEDMGAEKLDSAVYAWTALRAVRQMAEVLGDDDTAARAVEAADRLAARFEHDWWSAKDGVYAMSLREADNHQIPVAHWAVITPLEVGLASPQHAQATFDTLETDYLNEWGMKHTVGSDARVWTLPTATLSRAAYRYGKAEMGFQMLHHIAQTLDHGSIGLFHELIPEGLTTLQLWSGTTFVRGVVEDLLGVFVRADLHVLTVAPQLPAAWDFAELDNLAFGAHVVSLRVTPEHLRFEHVSGPTPLQVTYQTPDGKTTRFAIEPGRLCETNTRSLALCSALATE
jgi:glycogen debranching enzyme